MNFGEPRLAVAQLQQALAIHPTDEDALEDLTRLMSSLGDWTALCDAIRTFLASLPPHRQGEGLRQRMNLGRLLTHRLGLPSEALEQFSAVVEIDPTLPEARLASAILLEDSGREEEALGEHRELLEMDPLNLESLHRTAAICARRGAGGRAGAALGLLVALNEATAAEAEQQEPLCAPGRGGVAEIGTMEAVLAHPAEHGAAMRVLDVLGPTGNQLPPPFRPQPFSGSATPLTASGGHPVQEAVSAICRLLGVPRLSRILLAGSVLGGAGFYASNQLGLVVDRRLAASAGPAQLRSVLAGVLSYHRSFGGAGGLWLAHGQIPSRLEMLISAAYLVARADDSAASHPSRDLLALAGALDKAMPSNQREQLQDRCAALRSARKLDYEKWAGALEQTALRCSLWIAGDLPTVLDGLRAHQRRRSGQDDGASPMEWLRRDDPAKELVKFWLSEEHLSHRS